MAGQVPSGVGQDARGAGAAVFGFFTGPSEVPGVPVRRCEKRFRAGVEVQVGPKIDEQQAVAIGGVEKSDEEGGVVQHRAIERADWNIAEHLILPAEGEEVAVERVRFVILLAVCEV